MRVWNTLVVVCFALTTVCSLSAHENGNHDEEKKTDDPVTVELKRKDIRVFKTIDGVIESTKMTEISTTFDSWSDLTIESVLPQGATVDKGDRLLSFKTESFDKALADAKLGMSGAVLDAKDAELAQSELDMSAGLDAELAESQWKQAQEDHDYYFETQRPQDMKSLEFRLKNSQYSVENSQEELDQLKAMYTEDELTEESELIVLKRAERSLESAKRRLELTELDAERQKKFGFPRAKQERKKQLLQAEMKYEKFKVASEIKKARTAVAVEKAKLQLVNKRESLDKLLGDRKMMHLQSPASGVLYYGRCLRGKWVGVSGNSSRQLDPGKKVPVNKVVMTVVDPGSIMIRAELDEELVRLVNSGMPGMAKLTASPNVLAGVKVTEVGSIALDSGKYDCQLSFDDSTSLMPGMTCKVSLLVHEAVGQMVAPAASVFSDDGVVSYVYLANGERRDVQVGMKSGTDIEILGGLSIDEKILAAKPN